MPPLVVVEWVVVGGGVECVVVGGGVEWVVVGGGGGGVECVVVALVVVVIGVTLVDVVCVVRCGFAFALCGFFGVVVVGVVGVVAVVAALVVELEDAPQPAATSASETAVTHKIGRRLICILDKA